MVFILLILLKNNRNISMATKRILRNDNYRNTINRFYMFASRRKSSFVIFHTSVGSIGMSSIPRANT